MKFMTTWALLPGSVKDAAEHFLAGGGNEPEGVTSSVAGTMWRATADSRWLRPTIWQRSISMPHSGPICWNLTPCQ